MLDLQIHLSERLVHMLDVWAGHLHQFSALPHDCP